ncbi:MAG: efflux RND transporter periplasmic adaptor subunit [Polyangiales bacterium]
MLTTSIRRFVIVLVAGSCAYGCGGHKPEADSQAKSAEAQSPAVEVELGKVEKRPMPRIVSLLGNVIADRQSEVAANVSGQVIMAPVERGQKVKQGDTIVMVDSKAANLTASAAASQADLAAAQSAQAQADCERANNLLSQGAIGKAEFDRQITQCKAQQLQANAARSQAELSAKLAADALVRAPFSGVIGERFVNAGEYVQPSTRVATIYTLDPVRVVISVPEQAVSLVRKDATLNIQVSGYPDKLFPATVQYVSPALRTQQRDLLVEAKAQNPEGLLRPGMFATVQASLGEEQVATVPADAILVDGDVRRLFLVKDGRGFELVVRVGAVRDDRIAVYEDLEADVPVIRHPPATLRDGAQVTAAAGTHTNTHTATHTDTVKH